jgi:hypothetical protein
MQVDRPSSFAGDSAASRYPAAARFPSWAQSMHPLRGMANVRTGRERAAPAAAAPQHAALERLPRHSRSTDHKGQPVSPSFRRASRCMALDAAAGSRRPNDRLSGTTWRRDAWTGVLRHQDFGRAGGGGCVRSGLPGPGGDRGQWCPPSRRGLRLVGASAGRATVSGSAVPGRGRAAADSVRHRHSQRSRLAPAGGPFALAIARQVQPGWQRSMQLGGCTARCGPNTFAFRPRGMPR